MDRPRDFGVASDFRAAIRSVTSRPLALAIMAASLALTIGVTATVFTLIDRLVLRPLDVVEPERLVTAWRTWEFNGRAVGSTSIAWAGWTRLLESPLTSVDDIAVFSADGASQLPLSRSAIAETMASETIAGLFVTHNYFGVLGVRPIMGRGFAADDDRVGAEPVGILSYAAWRSRFGADPNILGRVVHVNRAPVRIVGVAPRGFTGTTISSAPPQLFLPLMTASRVAVSNGTETDGAGRFSVRVRLSDTSASSGPQPSPTPPPGPRAESQVSPISPVDQLTPIGRMARDATLEQAQAELLARLDPRVVRSVVPLTETMLPFGSRADLRSFLWLLSGAVALTLAVGCASVGGMLVARADERQMELAIRAALGASTARLFRQLALEAVMLGILGWGGALVVAQWIERLLSGFAVPGGIPLATLRPADSLRVMVFVAATTAIVTCVLCLMPALRVMRRDLIGHLTASVTASPRMRTARVLIGLQVAIGLCLLAGSTLFVRALSNALQTDVGIDQRGLVSVTVAPVRERGFIDVPAELRAKDTFLRQARMIPGVAAASVGPTPLMNWPSRSATAVEVDGAPRDLDTPMGVHNVASDYFRTLGATLVRGRDFGETDREGAPLVAIVSETAAAMLWPGGDPLDRRIAASPFARTATIVGVVRDGPRRTLHDTGAPALYLARPQHPTAPEGDFPVILRTEPARLSVTDAVMAAAGEAGVRVSSVEPFDSGLRRLLMPQRFGRVLLTLLALTAIALTLIGVYGLVAALIARTTREIGIRIALGATTVDIIGVVTRVVTAPAACGIVAGAAGAWWGGRFADRFMYGLSGSDPVTIVIAAAIMLGGVAMAALWPARGALSLNPRDTLRVTR